MRLIRNSRIRIGTLGLAVVLPLLAFGAVSAYIISAQHREAIANTVQRTAEAAMASADRELADHIGDAEVLAALADKDLNRSALFERQVAEAMRVRRGKWMNVVVASRDGQIYNYQSSLQGQPLPPARFAALDAEVMESGRTHVSGVRPSNERYPEPYFTIRVPIEPAQGPVTHLLVVVVRAWQISLAAKVAAPPQGWRIAITDPDGMIVGRTASTDPNDPLIGIPRNLPDGSPEGEIASVVAPDGQSLYVGTARSRLYGGWSAHVGLPAADLDKPLAATRISMIAGGLLAFILAISLGTILIRSYAREATTERLEASLREKDTLLREVYHRVKNNLQIVDGLMGLQSARLEDPRAKEAFADVRRRVHALGLVHQQLMRSKNLATFDIRPFLQELCDNIALSAGAEQRQIKVLSEADPLMGNLDFAVPLGLLITELVTNALKHGFLEGQAGSITVSLRMPSPDRIVLSVVDDGQAEKSKPDRSPTGVGFRIANALVGQLDGMMDIVYEGGTRIMVTMPRPETA